MVDRFTRWVKVISISNIITETVATAFVSSWVSRFGVSRVLISDRGQLGIQRRRTTAYHPSYNGAIERFHKTLKNSLRAKCDHPSWTKSLPLILFGIRSTLNKQGFSQAQLVFGSSVELPTQFFVPFDPSVTNPSFAFVKQFFSAVSDFQKPKRDHSSTPHFEPKNMKSVKYVWLLDYAPQTSLSSRYRGPYEVMVQEEKTIKLADVPETPVQQNLQSSKPVVSKLSDQTTPTQSRATQRPNAKSLCSLDNVVLAKFPRYPWYPALIVRCSKESSRYISKDDVSMVCFGTGNYAFIPKANIQPFSIQDTQHRGVMKAQQMATGYTEMQQKPIDIRSSKVRFALPSSQQCTTRVALPNANGTKCCYRSNADVLFQLSVPFATSFSKRVGIYNYAPVHCNIIHPTNVTQIQDFRYRRKQHPPSHLHPSSITVLGESWSTAEQLYQFAQSSLNLDRDTASLTKEESNGMQQKVLRKKINKQRSHLWNIIRYYVMLCADFEKYSQNAGQKQSLLNTGKRRLVENTSDAFRSSPNNAAGNILMLIRSHFTDLVSPLPCIMIVSDSLLKHVQARQLSQLLNHPVTILSLPGAKAVFVFEAIKYVAGPYVSQLVCLAGTNSLSHKDRKAKLGPAEMIKKFERLITDCHSFVPIMKLHLCTIPNQPADAGTCIESHIERFNERLIKLCVSKAHNNLSNLNLGYPNVSYFCDGLHFLPRGNKFLVQELVTALS